MERFPIVGIGASAGGVEALGEFFQPWPCPSGMAFVVATHLAPDHDSHLPEILAHHTTMRVVTATDGMSLSTDCIHVLPPGMLMTLEGETLRLHPRAKEYNAIDVFFASLADEAKERAIAVILSGCGHDGSIGIAAVHDAGGLTLVERDGQRRSWQAGMPASAVATGLIDIVAPVHEMAERISRYKDQDNPAATRTARWNAAKADLYAVLKERVGHDFSGYKDKTFLRRVRRRMAARKISDLDSYLSYVRESPEETQFLFRDLLIGVTSFFRDTEHFEALQREVLPKLFADKGPDDCVRVWVPGCATGEETYSLAILLREQMDRSPAPPHVQIFATDVDERAVSAARAGIYPDRLLAGMDKERLQRFFVHEFTNYQVSKEIRELCLFSPHSLIREPPFSHIDLISCRNLLIYFDTDLQKQVLPLFHYALKPGGYLFLGASESIGLHEDLFTAIDKKHRIFQRRDHAARTPVFPLFVSANGTQSVLFHRVMNKQAHLGRDLLHRVEHRILERFAPPHVVVNRNADIVHYSARTGKYFEAPSGSPSHNLHSLARQGLRLSLRAALSESIESGHSATRQNVPLDVGVGVQAVDLVIDPLYGDDGDPLWLVIITDVGPLRSPADSGAEHNKDDDNIVRSLEREIIQTREQLQSSLEEYEASAQDLKAANEELMSMNEELQSTNEELESSKEEMQSINEEMHTVNVELAGKLDELDRSNNDLKNLFDSTQVATIFLDHDLHVRNFTPAIDRIFRLRPGDRGRPLTDIASFIDSKALLADLSAVLDGSTVAEQRLIDPESKSHYLMRALPYHAPDGRIAGVVLTFVDISLITAAEKHQELLIDELNHRVKNILAVAISMASQMLARATSLDDFGEKFIGRLHSLAKTHELLAARQWTAVELKSLLKTELSAVLTDNAWRVNLEGPPVQLRPRSANTLGMVMHELVINALKYGSLSHPGGCLDVTWDMENISGEKVILIWREINGPPVKTPDRRGFGTTLIERLLDSEVGGSMQMDFDPHGVEARITLPLED